MPLFFVPDIVQSFIDLVVVALVEPESNDPDKCIDQEIDNGHENKAVKLVIPVEDPAKGNYDRIKSDAVKDQAENELILRNISIRKPDNSRNRTDSACKNDRQKLDPAELEFGKRIAAKDAVDKAFDDNADEDREGDHHSLLEPKLKFVHPIPSLLLTSLTYPLEITTTSSLRSVASILPEIWDLTFLTFLRLIIMDFEQRMKYPPSMTSSS